MNDFSNKTSDPGLLSRLNRRYPELEAEIRIGLDQLNRGECYSAEDVFADVRARIGNTEEAHP